MDNEALVKSIEERIREQEATMIKHKADAARLLHNQQVMQAGIQMITAMYSFNMLSLLYGALRE